MRKFGARYRTLFNKETRTIRNVYSPVIYKENGDIVFISNDDEIMEFSNRKDAVNQAEKTYNELKNKNTDWVR